MMDNSVKYVLQNLLDMHALTKAKNFRLSENLFVEVSREIFEKNLCEDAGNGWIIPKNSGIVIYQEGFGQFGKAV